MDSTLSELKSPLRYELLAARPPWGVAVAQDGDGTWNWYDISDLTYDPKEKLWCGPEDGCWQLLRIPNAYLSDIARGQSRLLSDLAMDNYYSFN